MPRSAKIGLLQVVWPLATIVIVLALRLGPLLARLELLTVDARFAHRGPRPPVTRQIVIVDLDDQSLADPELRTWPLPRRRHAQVIRNLAAAGAKVIALDMLFPEDSKSSEDDDALAAAVKAAGNVVLGAEAIGGETMQSGAAWQRFALGPAPPGVADTTDALSMPRPTLVGGAHGVGFINVFQDRDGTVRRVPLALVYSGQVVPSFDTQIARRYLELPAKEVQLDFRGHAHVGRHALPTTRRGTMMLDFLGPGLHTVVDRESQSPFQHVSYVDAFHGKVTPEQVQGKIVLIGWTVTGGHGLDHFTTPFDPKSPGVEVHATVLENLLTGRAMRSAPAWANLLALLGLALLPALATGRMPMLAGLAFVLLTGSGYWWVGELLFDRAGLVLDMVAPELGLLLGWLGVAALRVAFAERSLGVMRAAFEFYVSPEVLDKLVASGENVLSLDYADRREVTILFADVVSFVSMSEQCEPEDVTKIINELFTDLGDILLRYGAYLDMFMGDCLMAVFNAFPGADYPDHALRAVRAALEMQVQCKRLHAAAVKRGEPGIDLAIGVNTGTVVAGNVGSARQAHYTVIGDAVNLASRLERRCRDYQADLLIGAGTFDQCSYFLEMGRFWDTEVKGKRDLVRIYEIVGLEHEDELPVF